MGALRVYRLVDAVIGEIHRSFGNLRKPDPVALEAVGAEIVPIIADMNSHPALAHILRRLEQQQSYTYRHSIGVALMARWLGKAKGLHLAELLELTVAGFLHDIGKVNIPGDILNKPGKLTQEEFRQMTQHTVYGFEMLRDAQGVSARQALAALQHHEREDGSGYPYGIGGDRIDPLSKIVAVADVFHAMISERVYKHPIPLFKVLQEMSSNAFGTLEQQSTLYLARRMMELLVGSRVLLSNGWEGTVVLISPISPAYPLVEVNGHLIDLSKEPSVYLERTV